MHNSQVFTSSYEKKNEWKNQRKWCVQIQLTMSKTEKENNLLYNFAPFNIIVTALKFICYYSTKKLR